MSVPDVVIDVHGLTKRFGGRPVVRDLSMQVRRGTIYAQPLSAAAQWSLAAAGLWPRMPRAVRVSNLVQHHGGDKTQVAEHGLPVNTTLCEYCGAPQ